MHVYIHTPLLDAFLKHKEYVISHGGSEAACLPVVHTHCLQNTTLDQAPPTSVNPDL